MLKRDTEDLLKSHSIAHFTYACPYIHTYIYMYVCIYIYTCVYITRMCDDEVDAQRALVRRQSVRGAQHGAHR